MDTLHTASKITTFSAPYNGKAPLATGHAQTPPHPHSEIAKKRERYSSGASPQTQQNKFYNTHYTFGPSKDQFKSMSQDDKMFSMIELLGNLGRMAFRMDGFERDTYYKLYIHEVNMSRL